MADVDTSDPLLQLVADSTTISEDQVKEVLEEHKETGKPVLWADGAKSIRVEDGNYMLTNGEWYSDVLAGLRENHPHDVEITKESPNYRMR